ncbi:hypothetical protein L2E82_32936 [Cichorium intybus]|uniref:Uncharacterized protein n=1 Tax=Cichorium intybus TaxID=13427 RepID=A0ACB9BIE5_CICIN|nr:hypothetical protein L2E82_32936 [Cichorium intybus]
MNSSTITIDAFSDDELEYAEKLDPYRDLDMEFRNVEEESSELEVLYMDARRLEAEKETKQTCYVDNDYDDDGGGF